MELDAGRDILGQYRDHTVTPVPSDRRMRWHHHTCPDGTRVRVLAQYFPLTTTTLHRWIVNGDRVGTTPAYTGVDVPPSWAVVDQQHLAIGRGAA